MPRPTPTSNISLIDFAGARAVERLQQTSEVVAERRRQKRGAFNAAISSASDGVAAPPEAFFASRVDRASARAAPRRIAGHGRERQFCPIIRTGQLPVPVPSSARQAQADALRRRAHELAAAMPGDAKEEEVDAEGMRDQILRAFSGYSGAGGDEDKDAVASLEDWLARMRTCCICIELIRSSDRIWSCSHCSMPTHITCIQTWASRLIGFAEAQNMKDGSSWHCPNCRQPFRRTEYPSRYTCFCGKEEDPRSDPWLLPHSCGDHCEKALPCGHKCRLLCHPGRCPPCPLAVTVACYCGAKKQKKRCGNPSFSCGAICGRKLACGKHQCERECHEGDCGPCQKKIVSACRCGKTKKLLVCADAGSFQCENVCGALKRCKVHKCQEVCCKPGECPPCPTEKICACGRTTVRITCGTADTVRVRCDHTCNKMLDCKKHRCVRRCHDGPCNGCTQVSRKSCRCGAVTKDAPCSQELLCDKKCNKDRNCGRHKCNRRCCDGNCPPCTAACDRKLDCGVCRCTMVCGHGGFDSLGAELYSCPPCSKQNEVRCFCGATAVMVPCGLPKKPPPCRELCKIPPTCHHDARPPHRCHFGPCPPCGQECGAPMPCGHTCQEACHDPVPDLDLAAASWARRPRSQDVSEALRAIMPAPLILAQVKCPPCNEPVTRVCLGLHGKQNMKCHEQPWFSCIKRCGNWLPCGNHRCQESCHSVLNQRAEADFEQLLELEDASDGSGAEAAAGGEASAEQSDPQAAERVETMKLQTRAPPRPSDCGECSLDCMRARPPGCKHRCPWPCHFEPCPPCFEDVQVRCYCNQSLLTYACCEVLSWKGIAGAEDQNPFLRCPLTCHKRYETCPHMCPAKCHFGPCPPCGKQDVTARCRCGKVRKQLPCSEVWRDGKQLVLACTEDCKQEPAPSVAELLPPPPAAEETPTQLADGSEAAATDVRERRRLKQKKREEEMEERRRREEEERRRKLMRRRLYLAAIVAGCLLLVVVLFYFLAAERQRAIDQRERKYRESVGKETRRRRTRASDWDL